MASTDLLDLPTLRNLVDLDDGSTSLVAEMTALFREDSPRRIREIRTALQAGAREAASRTAHALKGGAGAIGAKALRAQAAELEALANDPAATVPDAALDQLETTFQATLQALEDYIRTGGSQPQG